MSDDRVVGHKTFVNDDGTFRHEPLTATEADRIVAASNERDRLRWETIPDEQTALRLLFDAYLRLHDFGWTSAHYLAKEGTTLDVIELGSTGVHRAQYSGQWPTGGFWIESHGDLWPSCPIMARPSIKTSERED